MVPGNDLPSECDVLLAHDAIVTGPLVERYPAAGVVHCTHGDRFDHDLPVLVPGVVDAVVVFSDLVARRVEALALDVPVMRLRQPIDTERFGDAGPIRPRPRQALILSNYLRGERRDALVRAWERLADLVMVRERAVLGEEVMIGRLCGISTDTCIGDRTRIQNECVVAYGTVLEEDVMLAPRAAVIGDPTMGRRDLSERDRLGTIVRRAARIGIGAIVFPPVEIGEEAVVGANAVVREDVAPRTIVVGAPARYLRDVTDSERLETWRSPPPGEPAGQP